VVDVALATHGAILLVLHLEHDGEDLHPGLVLLHVDVVAFGSLDVIGVLVEVDVSEGRGTPLVELGLAVLLERLAHHLGGKANALVAQAFDLVIAVSDGLVPVLERLFHLLLDLRDGILPLKGRAFELPIKGNELLFCLGRRRRHREPLLRVE